MKQRLKAKTASRKSSKTLSLLGHSHAKLVKSKALAHLRLVEHRHTARLVHPRHTSYVALLLMLAVTGFLMFISHQIVIATQISGSVSVGVVVPGAPPAIGATITSPKNGDHVANSNIVNVTGTCADSSFVVIYNNGQLTGSTSCTSAGIFSLDIQLVSGSNSLTALNFDNLNQPGPVTPSVVVQYLGGLSESPIAELTLPTNPTLIPGIQTPTPICADINGSTNSASNILSLAVLCTELGVIETCEDYKEVRELPTGGDPHIVVACSPRFFGLNENKKLGILVWGGVPPYAISLSWAGKGSDTLLSMSKPGYKTVETSGSVLGVYNVRLTLTDANDSQAITGASYEVSGQAEPQSFIGYVRSSLNLSWFETPVPIYLVAVAITLGFWGGDLFFRNFGAKKYSRRVSR